LEHHFCGTEAQEQCQAHQLSCPHTRKKALEKNLYMTKIDNYEMARRSFRISHWAGPILALAVLAATATCRAQSAGDTWQNLQEIVKFTQAHMSDDVIITYIKTSGKVYPTGADALLYLNSQGVSQPVLAALLGSAAPAPQPPPAVITAPPEVPTYDYFQAHLTPYGQWIDVPGVGAAWVPAEAGNPGWRPYMDAGHWEFTDAGWFWHSDYPWGDMAFHYGRWINNEFTGGRWAWAPGYNWAPSWVSWREGEGGMGWAPLPWGVEFRPGLGLYWHGAVVTAGIDFGLGFSAFVFVGNDHFWGGNYSVYVFNEDRSRVFFEHSTFHAGYRMEGGHLMAEGLGKDHIAAITHHEVVVHKAVELRHTEEVHNFAKRTEEHHDLARVVSTHAKEPARPEAGHGAASNRPNEAHERTAGAAAEHGATTHPGVAAEHGATTHPSETHTTSPATHPGAVTEREGTAAHTTETHPGAPGYPATTRPGMPGANSKEPVGRTPAIKPRPGGTNGPAGPR
jgi:hypothetical protein